MFSQRLIELLNFLPRGSELCYVYIEYSGKLRPFIILISEMLYIFQILAGFKIHIFGLIYSSVLGRVDRKVNCQISQTKLLER